MGERLVKVRAHKRIVAVSAAVLLPLSTAAAAASVASPSSPAATPVPAVSAVGSLSAAAGADPLFDSAPDVDKTLTIGSALAGGHSAVVVGSLRQRVTEVSATSSYDVPQAALDAYRNAQSSVAASSPGCHLSWSLLAGIGQVESDNGRYGGAVVLTNGDISPRILGPVLDGTGGVGAIHDTDGGRYDGDAVWDRAVGPMQFIPGTWAAYGADGNGDGVEDPNNIDDAALAAGRYLCAAGGDLRVTSQLRAAVLRYNHSTAYVDLVVRLASAYASGHATVVPNGTPGRQADTTVDSRAAAAAVHQVAAAGLAKQQERFGKVPGSGSASGPGHGSGGGGSPTPPPIHTHPVQTPPAHHPSRHQPPSHQPPPTSAPPTSAPTSPSAPPSSPPARVERKHTRTAPVVSGVLTVCASGWCVGTTALDFGADADLTVRGGDLNADGRTQSLERELRSLAGHPVIVTTVATTTPAAAVPGSAKPRPAPAADDSKGVLQATPPAGQVTPSRPAGHEVPSPVAITVDADGVVTSINGIDYAAPAR